MKKLSGSLACGVSLVLIVVSLSLHAKIEGIYVLEESDESRLMWKQRQMTIRVDEEGEYSATLTKETGEVLLTTQDIEVEQNKFKAVFTISSDLGEMDITFAGRVVDGKIDGTISESLFGSEVKLVANVKTKDTTPHQESEPSDHEDQSVVSDSSASQVINPEIAGTYVLEVQSNARKKSQPELTIYQDGEGEYSATLTAGKITETDDVAGEGNEFNATFTISTNIGEMDVTYAGRV